MKTKPCVRCSRTFPNEEPFYILRKAGNYMRLSSTCAVCNAEKMAETERMASLRHKAEATRILRMGRVAMGYQDRMMEVCK